EVKEKNKEYSKQYKKENVEYNSDYYQNNKDRIKECSEKYRKDNKEYYKKYGREYKKNRRKVDCIYKLNCSLSISIGSSLRFMGISKNRRHWEDLVGYTKEELKDHLEKQFEKGMTWDNHGEWHIDHIIPKSFFKYSSTDDTEFKYCWSFNNLQPLWAKDNLRKNKKVKYYNT
ncbi:MAG TPA: hypothetical protein VMZ91_07180, partial [Candidatus Paceibacterota bacterium]|nr:hypothetical protein [Candidatus Paceibacterota bacterium]